MNKDSARWSRRKLLLAAFAAAGCSHLRKAPPLAELYRDVMPDEVKPPLIVIPGAFGSRLRNRRTGEEIWPRSNLSLVFSRYPDIEIQIDPETLEPITGDIEAYAIFREGLGQDFYGALLQTLEEVGGYQRRTPGDPLPPPSRSYYIYVYDWRLDNVAAAQGLHALIEQVLDVHGGPDRQVDVLAHSSGGLLARYYARFGTTDVLGPSPPEPSFIGGPTIRRLLLVGTPNLGTIQPVLSHYRGEEIGLFRIPADVVATCPGAPQLMPHPELDWIVNLRGDAIDLDVYDIKTWQDLGWSIFSSSTRSRVTRRLGSREAEAHLDVLERYLARHLERGRRFQEALSFPAGGDEPRPYTFGSDCSPTPARLVLNREDGIYRAYDRPQQIKGGIEGVDYDALINEPGDGVVTRSSLEGRPPAGEGADIVPLEISQSVFLCEAHRTLTANLSFQDNLLYTLLRLEQ